MGTQRLQKCYKTDFRFLYGATLISSLDLTRIFLPHDCRHTQKSLHRASAGYTANSQPIFSHTSPCTINGIYTFQPS